MVARRFIEIAKNIEVFFFAFQLGFNRCIDKAKEFYPNVDPNFLTLTDMDAKSFIKEVMGGDPTSLVEVAHAVLDEGKRIINLDLVEDDPPLAALVDEKGKRSSSLYPKPPRVPRSKMIRRKR